VRRRLGDEVLHGVVAPIVVGLRGVHPDDLPLSAVSGLAHHLLRENSLARAVTRVRLEGSVAGQLDQPQATLHGGTATLIDRLLTELDRFGVPIELGTPVATVARDHVVLAGGPGEPAEPGAEPDPALVRHGRAVVRVHDRDAAADHPIDPEQARHDAAELLGVSIPPAAVRAAAVRTWRTAGRIDSAASAVPVVGEQAVGADLARIVAHARATARTFGSAED
jgi:oxygen-dependent protoporphyrinogen oxidase